MSSGFITESEVAEARKKRQEEWEKVRQPDEPMGMRPYIISNLLMTCVSIWNIH